MRHTKHMNHFQPLKIQKQSCLRRAHPQETVPGISLRCFAGRTGGVLLVRAFPPPHPTSTSLLKKHASQKLASAKVSHLPSLLGRPPDCSSNLCPPKTFQGGPGTEPEPETGTVGTVFAGTERGTGTAGTVLQEPKPEPPEPFSRNRNRNRNRPLC